APRRVPHRRVHPAERRADADREGTDRLVPEPRLLHHGLTHGRAPGRNPEGATPPAGRHPGHAAQIKVRSALFMGGNVVEPLSGRWFETIEPATERTLAEVADAGPEDVD